jgi:hypothetical protein
MALASFLFASARQMRSFHAHDCAMYTMISPGRSMIVHLSEFFSSVVSWFMLICSIDYQLLKVLRLLSDEYLF